MRSVAILVLALSTTFLPSALAQAPATPAEVQQAQTLIAAKDFAGAIAILEEFTTKNPQRIGALNILAGAYEQNGDAAKALDAYTKVAIQPQLRPQALYSIGVIHAQQARPEEALATFQRLRNSGSFDMDLLESDARLIELRKNPRFRALMPKPADFEKPFVEEVKVLYEIRGEAKASQFGWVARRIGDVDGDKVEDWTTSAPTFAVENQPAGRVYAYSGKRGALLWKQTGAPGEQLGMGIEGAGDTNADGIPDVIAGAPGSGFVYVYSGRDGKLLRKVGSGVPADAFGQHTATAGDLDGDEHDELLIGAPGVKNGAGAAYVYSGKDGSLLLTIAGEKAGDALGSTVGGHRDRRFPFLLIGAPGAGPRSTGRVYVHQGLSAKPKFTFDSDETGSAFGAMFVSIVGDVNADRTPDFYISDWANQANGPSTGRIYVYSGADGKELLQLTGATAGEGFGTSDSIAGDVDGDGHHDLIVGAWQHFSGAPSGGRSTLYSGKDGKVLRTYTCKTAGDTFGFDTTHLGDIDGDGTADFLITSAWSGVNGFQSGRVFVISSGVVAAAKK